MGLVEELDNANQNLVRSRCQHFVHQMDNRNSDYQNPDYQNHDDQNYDE